MYTLSGDNDLKAFCEAAYAGEGEEQSDRETEVVVLCRSPVDMVLVQHMQYHGRLLPALSSLRKARKVAKASRAGKV